MRTVRVNKGDLVNALTENRKKHKEEFDKACQGYRADMLAFMAEKSRLIEAGQNIPVIVEDTPPKDHTEDYNVALKMLEMEVNSVVELTHEEFRHMILDDWAWRRHWSELNTKYLGK